MDALMGRILALTGLWCALFTFSFTASVRAEDDRVSPGLVMVGSDGTIPLPLIKTEVKGDVASDGKHL